MDAHLSLETLFDDARDDNLGENDDETVLLEWQRSCVAALAGAARTCNAWLLIAGAAVALHSKQLGMTSSERDNRRMTVLAQLQDNPRVCKGLLRMTPAMFNGLCDKVRDTNVIKPTFAAMIVEQLACFLFVIGQKFTNRAVAFFLCRSGETISRYFHDILRAVISMEAELLKQPCADGVAAEIANNSRYFPFFKDCIGAVDGTQVRVKVPREDAARYRGRKDWPTQNVLACCSFDMRFTYVLAGWECSASDSRVFKSALTREDALHIPAGKYLLGDVGYGLSSKFLTPYGRTRYHLKEYSVRGPQNSKELFNLRHASLRNTIERYFGVLKTRFPILGIGAECQYTNLTMTKIVLACCIMHNFLVGFEEFDSVCVDCEHASAGGISANMGLEPVELDDAGEEYTCGARLRNEIAMRMWEDYMRNVESLE